MKQLLLLAICLAGCVYAYSDVRRTLAFGAEAVENRQHLLQLDHYLRFGQSARSVARLTGGEFEGDVIVVDTKMEFGARNWRMLLEFDERQRLRAVRYRCPDGVTIHPDDAPPDREAKARAATRRTGNK